MSVLCVNERCVGRGKTPRQADGSSYLCWQCVDRLYENIRAAVTVYEDLLVALTRQERPGERISGSKSGTGISLNLGAVQAREFIQRVFTGWVSTVVEHRGGSLPSVARGDVKPFANFLVKHINWLSRSEEFAQRIVADFWEAARGRPWRVAFPTGTRWFVVGRCPVVTAKVVSDSSVTNVQCEGSVTAIIRDIDNQLPTELMCDLSVDHVWPWTDWLKLGRHMESIGFINS